LNYIINKFKQKCSSPKAIYSFNAQYSKQECHHIPAKTFSNVIARFSPYYQYGLTATPFRKGNDEKLIFIHLGEKIAEIKPNEVEHYKRARIIVRNTSLCVPFNRKTDQFETLLKILVHDS
jgi:hypothetical protein